MPRIRSLHVYPVKSCRGNAIERMEFDSFGPIGDRRWMVINESSREFLSQRSHPELALLRARYNSSGGIELQSPRFETFLSVKPPSENLDPIEVGIWNARATACDAGDRAASSLSDLIGIKVRLVGINSQFRRPLNGNPEDETGFADGYPLLVISQASLEDLNQRLEFPVEMNRFRPNIVIEDCRPYDEDKWKRIKIGNTTIRSAGPCPRCIMTTVDPELGVRTGKEPLATLSEYRRSDDGVLFGQNFINESKSGFIEIGMQVEIVL